VYLEPVPAAAIAAHAAGSKPDLVSEQLAHEPVAGTTAQLVPREDYLLDMHPIPVLSTESVYISVLHVSRAVAFSSGFEGALIAVDRVDAAVLEADLHLPPANGVVPHLHSHPRALEVLRIARLSHDSAHFRNLHPELDPVEIFLGIPCAWRKHCGPDHEEEKQKEGNQ
jgi:hypothetical protein